MKIGFIGGGNMGEAMLSALLDKALSKPGDICAGDASTARRRELKQKYGISITDDNRQAAKGDVVILAVKPQNLTEVMSELKGQLKPAQLVLSIIAGASLATLCQGLNHGGTIRAMPNTPALVGKGITVWTAAAGVTAAQKEKASAILGTMGKEIYTGDEKYLDMATAISGSGPAYFFLFAEALTAAADDCQ